MIFVGCMYVYINIKKIYICRGSAFGNFVKPVVASYISSCFPSNKLCVVLSMWDSTLTAQQETTIPNMLAEMQSTSQKKIAVLA